MNQNSTNSVYVDIIATYVMNPTDIQNFDGITIVSNMESVYDLVTIYAQHNKKLRQTVSQNIKYGVANLHYGEHLGIEDYFVDFYGTMFYVQFYYDNYSKALLNNYEITSRIMDKLGLRDACLAYKNLFIMNLFLNMRTIGNDAATARGATANLDRMQHVCDIVESSKVGTFVEVADQTILDEVFAELQNVDLGEAAKMLMEFVHKALETQMISKTFDVKIYGKPIVGYVKHNIVFNNIMNVAKDTTFSNCLLIDYSQVIKGNVCWDYADLCIACVFGKIGYEYIVDKIREIADEIDDDELAEYLDVLDDDDLSFPLKPYIIIAGIKHLACIIKHYSGRGEEQKINTNDIVSVDNIMFLLKQEAETDAIFHPVKLLDEGIISLLDYVSIMIKYLEIIYRV